MNPIVSVVIPVYNSSEFLTQSVETLLSQTLKNFELILVDDGSTDDSFAILQNYQENDSRIQLISQKNQGAGVARNSGIALAQGEYILFLDSDDYFELNILELLVAKAHETGADVTICRAACFDHKTGKNLPSDWLRKDKYLKRLGNRTVFSPYEMEDCLFQFTYGWTWDKLFRLDYIREHNFLFPSLSHSEDLVFVYPALTCAKQISVIPESLVMYRMNRITSVSNIRNTSMKDLWLSMDLLENQLLYHNKSELYQQTFLNWAMEFCVWNVVNLYENHQCGEVYHIAKHERLKKYQFSRFPRKYYLDKSTYWKYILLKWVGQSQFFCIVKNYQRMKERSY